MCKEVPCLIVSGTRELTKGLTINDPGYYESDKNDVKGYPSSYPKVDTQTSDGKKRKVTDTSNIKFEAKK